MFSIGKPFQWDDTEVLDPCGGLEQSVKTTTVSSSPRLKLNRSNIQFRANLQLLLYRIF